MPAKEIELLNVALQAAEVGAQILESYFGKNIEAHTKIEIGELVTEADLAAEKEIRRVILSARPNDLVTGEEYPDSASPNAKIRWSIDPLDGTTNYTRGNPYFATSIGAYDLQREKWIVGVVTAPALEQTYFASGGHGAWVLSRGGLKLLRGPKAKEKDAKLLGTGFSYDPEVRLNQSSELRDRMEKFTDIRAIGSAAIAICAAASGEFDGYIETELPEYDWAGASVVAEEAGLEVARPGSDSKLFLALPF